jgi:hypothetical protein
MHARLLLLAALLLASPRPGAAQELVDRARNSPCTGVYTGSARGVFWCKVSVTHDPKANLTTFRVSTEGDIQLNGDALKVVPGTFQFTGQPTVGVHRSKDGATTSAVASLQTSQPPNQVDYAAGRNAPRKDPPDQGDLTLDLVKVAPGPPAGAEQGFLVHGTFSAHLLPLPGSKGIGDVLISVTF